MQRLVMEFGETGGVGFNAPIGDRMSVSPDLREQALKWVNDGIVISDAQSPDFPIVYSNPAFHDLTGYHAEEIIGENCRFLQGPDTDVATIQRIRDALKARTYFTGEILNYKKDGTPFWNLLRISPLRGDSGCITHFIGAQTDITDFKRAQFKLQESEQRFQVMANTAPVLVWMSGVDKACTFVNEQWLSFTGRSIEQELGNGWAEGVHPDDLNRCLDIYTKSIDLRQDFSMEYRLRHHDGDYRWILDRGTPRYGPGDVFFGYIGAGTDISDRVNAEQAVRNSERNLRRVLKHTQEIQQSLERSQNEARSLSGRLLSAHEEERRKIARELHDDLTQRLAVLAMDAGRLQKNPGTTSPEILIGLANMTSKLMELSEDVHVLSRQIHPSILDDLGLADAVKSECHSFQRREGIDVTLEMESSFCALDKYLALCLYRVVQEALRNVAKYAMAETVWVSLIHRKHEVILRIKDQGIGFDPNEAKHRVGLGLSSLAERVRIVGGQLRIESRPGRGTLIEVRAPVENKA